MAETLEQWARTEIGRVLDAAGWLVREYKQAQMYSDGLSNSLPA